MWPEGTGGYLGDELRSGHAQEVTQAVPLGSHDRELCIPGEEKRGAASAAGTVLQLNLPRSVTLTTLPTGCAENPRHLRLGRNQGKRTPHSRTYTPASLARAGHLHKALLLSPFLGNCRGRAPQNREPREGHSAPKQPNPAAGNRKC